MCLGFFVEQWYCTLSGLCLAICFNHHCSWQNHTTILSPSFSSNGSQTDCFGERAGCRDHEFHCCFSPWQDASPNTSGECVSKGKYSGSLYVEVSSQGSVFFEGRGGETDPYGVVSSTQGITALSPLCSKPPLGHYWPRVILFSLPLPSLSSGL